MEFVSKRVQHVPKLSQKPPRFCATDLQNLEQTKKRTQYSGHHQINHINLCWLKLRLSLDFIRRFINKFNLKKKSLRDCWGWGIFRDHHHIHQSTSLNCFVHEAQFYRSHLPLTILIMARWKRFLIQWKKLLKCVKKPNPKVSTPLKLNIAPEKGPSQKESQPPTIIWQWL